MASVRSRKDGRAWKRDCSTPRPRTETRRATVLCVGAFGKGWTGYHACSLRNVMTPCLRSFSVHTTATDPNRMTAYRRARVVLMKGSKALGLADIVRLA